MCRLRPANTSCENVLAEFRALQIFGWIFVNIWALGLKLLNMASCLRSILTNIHVQMNESTSPFLASRNGDKYNLDLQFLPYIKNIILWASEIWHINQIPGILKFPYFEGTPWTPKLPILHFFFHIQGPVMKGMASAWPVQSLISVVHHSVCAPTNVHGSRSSTSEDIEQQKIRKTFVFLRKYVFVVFVNKKLSYLKIWFDY